MCDARLVGGEVAKGDLSGSVESRFLVLQIEQRNEME